MAPRRRRALLASLALAAAAVVTLSRCDRRSPGTAAAPTPDERRTDGTVRRALRFPCGDATCAGWLYFPSDSAAAATSAGNGRGRTCAVRP